MGRTDGGGLVILIGISQQITRLRSHASKRWKNTYLWVIWRRKTVHAEIYRRNIVFRYFPYTNVWEVQKDTVNKNKKKLYTLKIIYRKSYFLTDLLIKNCNNDYNITKNFATFFVDAQKSAVSGKKIGMRSNLKPQNCRRYTRAGCRVQIKIPLVTIKKILQNFTKSPANVTKSPAKSYKKEEVTWKS